MVDESLLGLSISCGLRGIAANKRADAGKDVDVSAIRRTYSRSCASSSRSALSSTFIISTVSFCSSSASVAEAARSSLKATSVLLCIETTASIACFFSSLRAALSTAASSCAFLTRASSRSRAAAASSVESGCECSFSSAKKAAFSSCSFTCDFRVSTCSEE